MQLEKNIYLIGFMGAGKSSVSQAMAEYSGLREIDTDEEIVRREKRSIPEIFEQDGEDYFRKLETDLLRELSGRQGLIVSCGGGTILKEENRRLMKESGEVVLLSARPETIYERVMGGKNRPLLNGHMNVDYIAELLAKRMPCYEQAKTVEIATEDKTPEQIAEEIFTNV